MKGKICRFITGLVIASTLLTSCSAVGGDFVEDGIGGYIQMVSKKSAVKLAPSDTARFEALKGVPIDVIVDEESQWGMIDNVKQAIKNTIEQYNEMFSYINQDYQLRYISRSDYEKKKTDNPFIYITTQLSIQTVNGEARAVASPIESRDSRYGNGKVYSDATIIISSTKTVNLSVEEIQSVVAHEFGHAFGKQEHSKDNSSMMADTSSGVAISSKEFSLDLLTSFKEMYYNPETNVKLESEVDEYIAKVSTLRQQQVEEYIKQNGDNLKTALTAFRENSAKYIQSKGLQTLPIENLVDKEYSSTSIYGQTRTIIFNKDGTYTLQVFDDARFIECKGSYVMDKDIVICDGEFFEVDKDFNYVKKQDKLYFSVFEEGCIYSTESSKGKIIGDLTEVSLVEDLGV